MNSPQEAKQERDWRTLHDAITATLDRFGRKDAFGEGDYWLVDDNWGWMAHQLEFQNLALFKPHIIKALQGLLTPYPDWRIIIGVAVPGKEEIWPGMGLIVYSNEVVDQCSAISCPWNSAIWFLAREKSRHRVVPGLPSARSKAAHNFPAVVRASKNPEGSSD